MEQANTESFHFSHIARHYHGLRNDARDNNDYKWRFWEMVRECYDHLSTIKQDLDYITFITECGPPPESWDY